MRDSLIAIPWGGALLGKTQGRCDGAGSEVIGGKPSVNRALRGTLREFCLDLRLPMLGWSLRAEDLTRSNAKKVGRCCPAFILSWAGSSYGFGVGALQSPPDLQRLFQIEILAVLRPAWVPRAPPLYLHHSTAQSSAAVLVDLGVTGSWTSNTPWQRFSSKCKPAREQRLHHPVGLRDTSPRV